MEEEDLENRICMMLHDCLALQATEKSLYDASNFLDPMGGLESLTSSSEVHLLSSGSSKGITTNRQEVFPTNPYWIVNSSSETQFHPKSGTSKLDSSFNYEFLGQYSEPNNKKSGDYCIEMVNNPRENKNLYREDRNFTEEQARKKSKGGSNGRGGKKQGVTKKEVVDLRSLLMECAQAVAIFDSRTVNDLLLRIRQHSSPQGDATERLAHYFANALEARLAGTGTTSYVVFNSKRISVTEIFKAYKTYITACPFKKISNLLANTTIGKLAIRATRLHIIDFGILYGYQWPCLIQALSERPGGPPKLRITGIDFPQPGRRPAELVEDTGRRLAKYCERFGVPFEYNAIAQNWDTVRIEDVKIEKNEVVVVNSLYRFHNVLDETVMLNGPRDAVLKLIKTINPDMFIHGVVSGTYNTPFFMTRFKEALFHFSSMFDMCEATIPREDEYRLRFEHIFGRDAMNIIACEGTERIERPETYKQWQVRHLRVGFRQLPLNQEIVKYVKNKVKLDYHKDFSVEEDSNWMLQGWKGRVILAISYWQPAHN